MKHLHSFAIILMMAIILPTLTSCLGDDNSSDDNTIVVFDQDQKRTALQQLIGTYTSTLSYTDGTTATATWHISTDSAIVCTPFPMKVMVNALSSTYPTQSEIFKKAETQTLKGTVHPVYSYGSTLVFTTKYEPMNFTVGEGDDAHTVEIQLAETLNVSNMTAQSCVYYANQQLRAILLFGKVTIDGTDYNINSALSLMGTKQ